MVLSSLCFWNVCLYCMFYIITPPDMYLAFFLVVFYVFLWMGNAFLVFSLECLNDAASVKAHAKLKSLSVILLISQEDHSGNKSDFSVSIYLLDI